MAVSRIAGSFLGVLTIRALFFESILRSLIYGNSHTGVMWDSLEIRELSWDFLEVRKSTKPCTQGFGRDACEILKPSKASKLKASYRDPSQLGF